MTTTDWLSKIEAENRGYRKVMRLSDNETKLERMARVIRELAGYAMIVRDTGSVIDIHERERRAYFNLSPDAKELLKCSDG